MQLSRCVPLIGGTPTPGTLGGARRRLCIVSPAQAKPKADAADAQAVEADVGPHPVLDRIRSTGRIVLAHRESSVPFSYYDANKKPVGYALDLCKDVAEAVRKHLGLKSIEIAYLPISTATRMDAIISGKADLECGATTNNAERRQKVAFTVPHYITGTRFAVRADSPLAELSQFEKHVLVSTAGSTPLKTITMANNDRLIGIKVQAGRTTPRRWRCSATAAPTASRWTTCSCMA